MTEAVFALAVGGALGAFGVVVSAAGRLWRALDRFRAVLGEAAEPRVREAFAEVERSAEGVLRALAGLSRGLSPRR